MQDVNKIHINPKANQIAPFSGGGGGGVGWWWSSNKFLHAS